MILPPAMFRRWVSYNSRDYGMDGQREYQYLVNGKNMEKYQLPD